LLSLLLRSAAAKLHRKRDLRLHVCKRFKLLFLVFISQGITEAKVDKVLEAINKEKSFTFISGSQCLQNRQRIVSPALKVLRQNFLLRKVEPRILHNLSACLH
jgi:hypothetical protein